MYDDVLINKFGGDDASLAALEGTELIAVLHRERRSPLIQTYPIFVDDVRCRSRVGDTLRQARVPVGRQAAHS